MKTAPPGGGAAEAPNGEAVEGADACPGWPNWNGEFVVPDADGRPGVAAAGDAGWLPNEKGFDGAVAEVGVVPNENGAVPNVEGLGVVDVAAACPNPPVLPEDVDGPKPNGAAAPGVAELCPNPAEPPNGPGDAEGAGASAGFCPKPKPDPLC